MSKTSGRKPPSQRDAVREPRAFLRENQLNSVREAVRHVYSKRRMSPAEADRLIDQLTGPARILEKLRDKAVSVLTYQPGALAAFRASALELNERFPHFHGSFGLLKSRLKQIPFPGIPPGRSCFIVNPPGPLPIYMALLGTFEVDRALLLEVQDVVVGLSLQHGHLEVLNSALRHKGLEGVEDEVKWQELLEERYSATYRPLPSDGKFSNVHDWPLVEPVEPFPGEAGLPEPFNPPALPRLDLCELMREECEAQLVDILHKDPPPLPLPPIDVTWSHTITHIEMHGQCARDTIVIHGEGFGPAKPQDVELVMKVDGRCRPVKVLAGNWTDTKIEVILPQGINVGPVGFINIARFKKYVDEVAAWNERFRGVDEALKCLGQGGLPSVLLLKPPEFPCPGETGVNVITAGLPIIHRFSAEPTTIDPADNLLMTWEVENAETISLTRISNEGPTFGGNFSVQNPSGSSFLLTPAGHTDFGRFRYRLVASNSCGQVKSELFIVGSKRPGVSIHKIEVTQGIQTIDNPDWEDNGLRLVTHKPTVARVYLKHKLDGFGTNTVKIRGRLHVLSEKAYSPWLDPINGPSPPKPTPQLFEIPATIDREDTNSTLNFLLPRWHCEGKVELLAEIIADGFGFDSGMEESGFTEEAVGSVKVEFIERNELKIRYTPFVYNGDTPSHDEAKETLRKSLRFLPTQGAKLAKAEYAFIPPLGSPDTIAEMDEVLLRICENNICDAGDSFWKYIGFDVDCDDNEWIYAIMIGDNPAREGNACWLGWQFIVWKGDLQNAKTFYARAKTKWAWDSTGHELIHTLGERNHVNTDKKKADPPTLSPDEWPNGGYLRDVPFDIESNKTVVSGPYKQVPDIMTYNTWPRWTSPKRWEWLFDRIGG
jgi:hypothetical protein